ncbi:PLP-dependent aminotransferase family protein [Micrococcus terreus]|uniref:aminotransferase-like domain-containing protein n=1 Tax=Micrococcus terreus TaxID=574650 RepID=UPI0021A54231|nr:PLP-dependent aminotransferase family protein [Micrococcus terreus]MCT2089706.1 PLP-dependent aminotransferase family protein [Micrococcus terreus]
MTLVQNPSAFLSDRARGVRQSAVRDVFDLAMTPGLISLAGGNPWLDDLPLDELGRIAQELVAQQGQVSLQYGTGQGTPEMRQAACTVMAADGIPDADPELVTITPGSQAGIDTAARMLGNPGDVVVVEDPSFVGALNTFNTWELDAVATPTDEHGLIPEGLRETLQRLRREGRRIAFLYTIPSFANPSGALLPADRRDEVAQICREAGVLIVEDNPYGQLAFGADPVPPIAAKHRDQVIYLSTMSKIFSPGVRVGWALCPPALQRAFYLSAESAYIHASILSQMLTTAFVTHCDWTGHVQRATAEYQVRADALVDQLRQELDPAITFIQPQGGFFLWGTLPQGADTLPLMHEAAEQGVVFVPGGAFSPDDVPHPTFRLAYSFVPGEQLREGVRRLAPVLNGALDRL